MLQVIVGVLKEVKTEEYRVGAPPMAVDVLTKAGHQVLVQSQKIQTRHSMTKTNQSNSQLLLIQGISLIIGVVI